MDGLFALDYCDMVIEVSRLSNNVQAKHTSRQEIGAVLDSQTKTQHVRRRQKVVQLSEVGYVPPPTHILHKVNLCCTIFEDSESVIKKIIRGRSPTMRHVSRTHRVVIDWMLDRITLEPKIQIKYVDIQNQLADQGKFLGK